MKLVLVSSFLNHHQQPLCEAFRSICDDFWFVATESAHNVGYQVSGEAEYVLHYFDDSEKELVRQKVLDADVVIFGACPTELIEHRMKENKLSFVYSERFFKKGTWRRFIPSTRKAIKRRIVDQSRKSLYVLSASAFLSYDLSLLGYPTEKCFKWGYFPRQREYENIGEVIDNKKPNTILWCGRLIGLKHAEHAVTVAKMLKDNGYEFELNIIGDGAEKNKLEELIKRTGLSDRVRLVGSKSADEVRKYMEYSQIFLFTSNRMEGWGAVLNESMNAGCAVVASHAIGSVPFLIDNGLNGEVYESGNINDLYNKIVYLFDNPQKTREMGERAYHTLISEWTAKEAATRLITLAQTLETKENADSIFVSGPCSQANVIKDVWYKKKRS
ncbi:MAG: glycosyltransferase family 4 protein [Clostridia bacterium]|nr:glycosyltransferase family 4 protein [Clostridia bacterium]